ncbi:MAG: carbohydrate kinase family protein [Patescibacteria group bacterium]
MYDLVSIGTVAVDLYFKGDSLTLEDNHFQLVCGGKYFADGFYEGLGGGATNVAIGSKKNGLRVALAATIGENVFKKVILHKLDELNVDYSLSIFEKDFYNISAVLIAPHGDRSIVNYRSKHQDTYDDEEELQKLANTKMVYLANLPSLSLPKKTTILKFFRDKNITTFANLGTTDCKRDFASIRKFLKQVDVLIINAHEFSEMIRTPYEEINFNENVKEEYLGEFSHLKLILTDGLKGSYGYYEEKVYHQEAVLAEKVIDATGAGDGYTAGFISSYSQSHDIVAAMKKGAEYSSYVVSVVGAN